MGGVACLQHARYESTCAAAITKNDEQGFTPQNIGFGGLWAVQRALVGPFWLSSVAISREKCCIFLEHLRYASMCAAAITKSVEQRFTL
jgi:hypothetical protein